MENNSINKSAVPPLSLQQSFWNCWNASSRENSIGEASIRQAEVICDWLDRLGRTDLDIIDVGCGTGWLCPDLLRYGRVTATDFSDEVIERARDRIPDVTFVSGDFMGLDFGESCFDVVVSLELLAHVNDQNAFIEKAAGLLRPGGHLMLATQNRFVLQYLNRIPPPGFGQIRKFTDRRELRHLLEPHFEVSELFSVTPQIGRGLGLGRWLRLIKGNPPDAAPFGSQIETSTAAPIRLEVSAKRRHGVAVKCLEAMGLGWTLMTLARKRNRG